MNDERKPSRDPSIWEALGIAWDLLVSVLVTATVFALLGVFLDRWFGTKYAFKIAAFILMIIVGYRVILIKGRAVAKRLDAKSVTKKDDTPHEHPPAS
jgi:F0F1-type ATP synthase assembly protein I